MVVAMSSSRLPAGSSSSEQGGRPRAQVAYEGEDEFSTVSLDPKRKRQAQDQAKLAPEAPGHKARVKVDELKPTNEQGVFGLLRKIFAK
jgi:hypothetical protein